MQLAANLQCQIAYTEYKVSEAQRKASQARLHGQRFSTSSLLDVRVDDAGDLIAVTTDNNNTHIKDHHHYHYHHYFGGQYEHQHGHEDHPDYDTFDNILQATTHHDAMYAYYYLDDNNKVLVTFR